MPRQNKKRKNQIAQTTRRRARDRARYNARRNAELQNRERQNSSNSSSFASTNACDRDSDTSSYVASGSSLFLTEEVQCEISFNDITTQSERNGGIPATIEETPTFSLCQSIDKITPAKKALQFLMRTKIIEQHDDEDVICHRMPVCIICDSLIKGCNSVENVRKETVIKKSDYLSCKFFENWTGQKIPTTL